MPTKRTSARQKPTKKPIKAKKNKTYLLWAFQFFVIIVCIATAYLMWLDYQIRHEFDGKKWALPARVYASPLEIYPGLDLSRIDFEKKLKILGYEQTHQLSGEGQFRKVRNGFEFNKRSFIYWDGPEVAQSLKIVFIKDYVADLTDLKTRQSVDIVRLEPELIGKIYPKHNEDRTLIQLQDVPRFLIEALISNEDRQFFAHSGIDLRGIARAFFVNLQKGEISQGGSTLTQQLVKNFFLTPERTLWRKIKEIIMAILLENRYSKEEILAAYINEVYLGQFGARSIHGFGTAAEFYFARPLSELRQDQLALLVGLVRGASYYNPRRHPERAIKRRNLVLDLMQKQNYLSDETSLSLQKASLGLSDRPSWGAAKYPAFLDLLRRHLLRDYKMSDLQNEGLKIFTTLEPDIQEMAETQGLKKINHLEVSVKDNVESLQMAVLITRISSGEVLAVVGGKSKQYAGFNRALDATRPIGSLVKPAIYLSALAQSDKYNLLSMVEDAPLSIPDSDGETWQPRNYDRIHHGNVPLFEALKNSYNLASVQLGMEVGLDEVIRTLHKLGIKSRIDNYPSILLGALELSPLEVSQMYQTIANGGFKVPLNSIREVLDNENKPLQRYELKVEQKIASAPVFLLTFILSEVTKSGTASSLQQTMGDWVLAGKTGTTNDLRDSWFAGFGDDLLAVVWLGYDDNQPTHYTGASGALQVWTQIMKAINLQSLDLLPPEEITWLQINEGSPVYRCLGLDTIPYIVDKSVISQDVCNE